MDAGYEVGAVHMDDHWLLLIQGGHFRGDDNMTRSKTLAGAHQAALEHLRSLGHDVTDEDVTVTVSLRGLEKRAQAAHDAVRAAEARQRAAAREVRDVARKLVAEEGLTHADAATILGVSRGRVSQYVK